MQNPWIRSLLCIVVYTGIVTLPWWLSVVFLAGLTVYIPFYIEILFFGFLFDILYASHYSFPYTGLFSATVFLIVTMFVRSKIRT